MAEHLHEQMNQLKQEMLRLGGLVEDSLLKSIRTVGSRDEYLAREVIQAEGSIDRIEVQVEEHCLCILALFGPVACDLRFVVTAMKINKELERIGDLAEHVAKRILKLVGQPAIVLPAELQEMGTIASSMVRRSLDAFLCGDAAKARLVIEDDDRVDSLRSLIRRRLEAEIARHTDQMFALMQVLRIAGHLERVADTAKDIAEEAIYLVEGSIIRHQGTA